MCILPIESRSLQFNIDIIRTRKCLWSGTVAIFRDGIFEIFLGFVCKFLTVEHHLLQGTLLA